MTFQVPGDPTHPLNTQFNTQFPFWLAGKPDPEHRAESRELFPKLPNGYVNTQMLDVVHGAPIVKTESTDLPSAEVVQNIASILRTNQVVLRLAEDIHKRTGLIYRANGTGPFPEDLDE